MNFVFPTFLWALLLLAVPIIIHLFNFRRFKTVLFTNVKDLQELKEETGRRNRLKHFLTLILRCLFLIFLVAAFAQPFIKGKDQLDKQGDFAVGLFIDNSYSMGAKGQDQSLLEQAKIKAQELVEAFDQDDQFQVLTQSLSGRELAFLNKEQTLQRISEIDLVPYSRPWQDVVRNQSDALLSSNTDQQFSFLFSDFQKQKGIVTLDSNINYSAIPFEGEEQKNLSIDSVWMSAPLLALGQNAEILVRLKNFGEAEVIDNSLNLKINGQVKSVSSVSIGPGESEIDTLRFKITEKGWHRCEVFCTDFPITFDDQYFFSFKVEELNKVLSINQGGVDRALQAIFKNREGFELQQMNVGQIDFSSLQDYRLVILNDLNAPSSGLSSEIKSYVENGGKLFCSPGEKADLKAWAQLCSALSIDEYSEPSTEKQEVDYLKYRHPVFNQVFQATPKNIDLPQTSLYYPLKAFSRSGANWVMRFKSNEAFLNEYRFGAGRIFQVSAPMSLDKSTLKRNELFPLMMHNITLLNTGSGELAYQIGESNQLEISTNQVQENAVLKMRMGDQDLVPGQRAMGSRTRISLNTEIGQAGNYELYGENQENMYWVAMNHNRRESKMTFWEEDDLSKVFTGADLQMLNQRSSNLGASIREKSRGKALWKLCVIFALIFLAAEVLVLRFWRA